MIARLVAWGRRLKRELDAVSLAIRDPRVPWQAKALGALVLAYAFSPIDLIPDFIPVLGYLDDAILVPIGIWLVLRLIPPAVMEDARRRAADSRSDRRPRSWVGAALVVTAWVGLAVVLLWWLLPHAG